MDSPNGSEASPRFGLLGDRLSDFFRRAGISRSVVDGAVLLVVLALSNWWLDRSDPGWLGLNPTPWLLLPVFLGARYGLQAGAVGALSGGAVVLIWGEVVVLDEYHDFFQTHPYYFLSLLAGGITAGVGRGMVVAKLAGVAERSEAVDEELLRREETIRLLHRDRELLQQALLKHGAAWVCIPDDLRRLFGGRPGDFGLGFLALLRNRFSVREAAIYTMAGASRGERLTRKASSGGENQFAESLDPGEIRGIIRAALDGGELVTCRHLWEETPDEPDAILAAFPCRSASGTLALLVVRRMDFDEIHWDNLDRIETLWAWVLGHARDWLDGTPEGDLPERGAASSPEEFCRQLEMARLVKRRLQMGFQVVEFDMSRLDEPQRNEWEAFLLARLGRGEVMSVDQTQGEAKPAIQILLPERDGYSAEVIAKRWVEEWDHPEVEIPFVAETVMESEELCA